MPVDSHKRECEVKSTIKPYKLDLNQTTGIQNFSEIAKNPLKIPQYALDIEQADRQPQKEQTNVEDIS